MTAAIIYISLSIISLSLMGLLWMGMLYFYPGLPSKRKSSVIFPFIGNRGEAKVRREFTHSFHGANYHLLNNITIPFGDGTTQIDHILISTKGVFVIETKDYSGWIFADTRSAHWTQVHYRVKHQFRNPIRQNYRHVKAIQKLLDFLPREHIHSVVVFTGTAEFKTEMPENVFGLSQLGDHVRTFQDDVMTMNRMQFCVGRVECLRYQISRQTDVEHMEYLRRKFGDV